jgi:tetratricopeptide (TPR) repeat protein
MRTALGFVVLLSLGLAAPAFAQDPVTEWQDHLGKGAQAYGVAELEVAGREMDLALAIAEKNFAPDDPKMITTWLNLMPMRRAQNRFDEAVAFGQKVLPALAAAGGPDNPDLMPPLIMMAATLRDLKRYDEADKMYVRTIELHTQYFGDAHPRTVTLYEDRAVLLGLAGRQDESLALWAELVDLWEYGLGPNHLREAISRRGYADALRKAGKVEEAAAAEKRAAEVQAVWDRGR